MNTDTIKGSVEKITGKAKEAIGNATGNDRLAVEGQGQQIKGSVRQTLGEAKDKVSDAADYVSGR
jgi:uncharacterized protein YjbJ (UPF0337 family)